MKKDDTGKTLLKLYDHYPEILASDLIKLGLVAMFFQRAVETEAAWAFFSPFAIFWMTTAMTIVWAISYRFNLSKGRFLIVFFGTICVFGIPAILEACSPYVPNFHWFRPYHGMALLLGKFAPQASSGAYGVYTLLATIVWLVAWAAARWGRQRLHLTRTHLIVIQADGKQDTHELVGLHMEEDPFDYSEVVSHGAGSVALKTRGGKVLGELKRVTGLYWCLFRFWQTPKKVLIDQLTRESSGKKGAGQGSQDQYDDSDDDPHGDATPDGSQSGDSREAEIR